MGVFPKRDSESPTIDPRTLQSRGQGGPGVPPIRFLLTGGTVYRTTSEADTVLQTETGSEMRRIPKSRPRRPGVPPIRFVLTGGTVYRTTSEADTVLHPETGSLERIG